MMTEWRVKPDQPILTQIVHSRQCRDTAEEKSLLDPGITVQKNKPEETTVLLPDSMVHDVS